MTVLHLITANKRELYDGKRQNPQQTRSFHSPHDIFNQFFGDSFFGNDPFFKQHSTQRGSMFGNGPFGNSFGSFDRSFGDSA